MSSFSVYLLESGIGFALFFIIYWIFLRRDTFFALNRFYLILSIIFSLIIPFMKIPSPGGIFNSIHGFLASIWGQGRVVAETAQLEWSANQAPPSINLSDVLWVIYFLGVGALLFRFIFHLVQILMMKNKYGTEKIDGYNIVFTDHKFPPFSFLNTIFINKEHSSEKDLHRIIAHERVHLEQYHSIDLILVELIIIFQWINPFVWPYKGYLKETHEYLADDGVIAQGCDTAMYQMLVFEQSVGVKLFGFSNNFNQSQTKRRIKMMTKNKSGSLARAKALLFLPASLILLLAFATPMVSGGSKTILKSEEVRGTKTVQDVSDKQTKQKIVKKKDIENKQNALVQNKAKLKAELVAIEEAMKKVQAKDSANDQELEITKKELAEKIKIVEQKLIEIENAEKKVRVEKKKLVGEKEFENKAEMLATKKQMLKNELLAIKEAEKKLQAKAEEGAEENEIEKKTMELTEKRKIAEQKLKEIQQAEEQELANKRKLKEKKDLEQ